MSDPESTSTARGHPGPDRPRICVLGSFNMDLVVRAPVYPARGQTIVGTRFGAFPGGKGANQAVAAARMGAQVAMVGAVGDDAFGREFLATLAAEHVDTSRVLVRQGVPTGVGVIVIDESPGAGAANTIVVALGANLTLTPADADAARDAIAGTDVLLMQLETPLETVTRAAQIAREAGTTVILNAAPIRPVGADLIASVDAIIMNEEEGEALCGPLPLGDAKAGAERLATIGPDCAVVTLGERGAVAAVRAEPVQVPTFAINPVDTVGAGDAFCGAFACRWAEHQIGGGRTGVDAMAVMDAMCWGCAAGAIAVTRHGAIPSLPTRAEVVAMLRQHPK